MKYLNEEFDGDYIDVNSFVEKKDYETYDETEEVTSRKLKNTYERSKDNN